MKNRTRFYRIPMMERYFKKIKPNRIHRTLRRVNGDISIWTPPHWLKEGKPFIIDEVHNITRKTTFRSLLVECVEIDDPDHFSKLNPTHKKDMRRCYGSGEDVTTAFFYRIGFILEEETQNG